MIWVVVTALIVSMGLNVLLSVLVARQSEKWSTTLERAHERATKHTEGLVDRIVAGDWQTYKAYELMDQTMPEPEDEETEPELVAVRGPDRGGFGSKFGLAAYRPPEVDIAELESEIPG